MPCALRSKSIWSMQNLSMNTIFDRSPSTLRASCQNMSVRTKTRQLRRVPQTPWFTGVSLPNLVMTVVAGLGNAPTHSSCERQHQARDAARLMRARARRCR
eukprot:CAMPEP_0168479870 /NCGR_PEP_ID=MMETSP0228-20121227/63693_1 /TAXON_ID=133427 /ORGANISM="Protoceratium reticulatum, Strain CCCM 535 (=CCMP 1889)" /LENGTH=100 /DNA_ID=CAMNT_0008496169 /DNA_START=307 /DNA_END=609 /DNA_ORIENTATION=-